MMRLRFAGLWRHAEFLKFWAAQTISLFGSEITYLALPLLAALTLGASPAEMGILTAAGTLPYLAFGLVAGVWVDRLPRRPLMVTADVGRALLLTSVPLAAWFGMLRLEQLYVVAFFAGTLSLLFATADNAYLPSLVGRDQLVEANGKLALSTALSEGTGPGLASVLAQALTAPVAILLDALSFGMSAALLSLIRTQESRATRSAEVRGVWREVGAGLRFVMGEPLLRSTTALSALLQLGGGVTDALLVYYVTATLDLPPTVIGLFFVVGSVSAMLASIFGVRVTQRLGIGPTVVASVLLMSVGWLGVPLASGPTPILVVTMVSGGLLSAFGNTTYNINVASIRQAATPNRLLGRVGSSNMFVGYGALPIGALLGGAVASRIGVRETLLISMLAQLPLLVVLLFTSPLPKLRTLPPSPTDEDDEMIQGDTSKP
jgi:MFS family permease